MAHRGGILRRLFFVLAGLVLAMSAATGTALASGGSGGTVTPPPDFILTTSAATTVGANVSGGFIVPGGFPTCPAYIGCNPDRNWEPREIVWGFFGINGYEGSTIILSSLNGFSGTVTLELLNLPPGVTSQTATTLTATANATTSTPLKLQASSTTPLGDSTVTVRATSGSLVHGAAYPLHVVDPLPASPPQVNAPFSVVGGGQYQATASLAVAAPAGGLALNLSTSDTAVASVPATVTIPGGATSASFTITTSPVTTRHIPQIQAAVSPNGWPGADDMTVEPSATLDQVILAPASAVGGDTSALNVTLSSAVAQPTVVNLSSSDPAIAPVPASVTIPAGSSQAFPSIATATVTTDTVVAVSGTFNGVTKLAYLGVTAAASPPPGGVVSLKQAQYDTVKNALQVEVNSSDAIASEAVAVFVGSTVQKIGTLTNAGGGTFKGTLPWPVNPQTVAIASSRGWSFPDVSVTAK